MISNKTLGTLFLITLNMQLSTSASFKDTLGGQIYLMNLLLEGQGQEPKPKMVLQDTNSTVSDAEVQGESVEPLSDVRGSSPSVKPAPPIRKRIHVSKPKNNVLQDTTSTEEEVQPAIESVGEVVQVSEQPVSTVNNRFKALFEQGDYEKIFEIVKEMNGEEFLKQLYSAVETLDQYNGIVKYLKRWNLVASFYIHGNIGVVKGAIMAGSRVYGDYNHYVKNGDLETALILALKEDRHNRFMELLDVRKGITAEKDEQLKLEGMTTSFDCFVYYFLKNLAPWENGMVLRRFFILRGDVLRSNHHDISDTLCQELVCILRDDLHLSKAERLLVDLIGQPSLLTPMVFAKIFLGYEFSRDSSNFIKYGWREAIQEGLKTEYRGGRHRLWLVMQAERPDQFPGDFPKTDEERAAACMRIPTKQQKEEQWADENAKIFYAKIKNHDPISQLLPDVLWPIVFGYVILQPNSDDPIILK